MDIVSIVKIVGGLGLLLYGMNGMGNALEKLAGEKLGKTLEKISGNLFKSVVLGALVTAVIQSSTGTTVMVVGFVNAGIMKLKQAVGIIMGANIGTTVTAQLLRLDSSGAGGAAIEFLKPSVLCYFAVALGAVFIVLSKRDKLKTVGEILVGIGLLFLGMSIMETSVSSLQHLPAFQRMFVTLKNPVMGVLAGALVTAVIQSSAASVGILQAAAATGAVSYAAAIPIIMGQNIGTCLTALLSSLGGNRNAKRAAMVHFYFNLIGSVVFIAAIYTAQQFINFSFWDETITKGAIANFHTLFNISTTALFLPFSGLLVKLAEMTVRVSQKQDPDDILNLLDPRFYSTPSVALEQCGKVVTAMGDLALSSFLDVNGAITEKKPFDQARFLEQEDLLDRCEARINAYMIGMKDADLSDGGKRHSAEILHAIGDFERIGDYCENLMDQYHLIGERQVEFSESAVRELKVMSAATETIIRLTNQCYAQSDPSLLSQISALEDIIDTLKETLKSRHIARLQAGTCTVGNGIPFLDIIHNYEKISDHCSNIAVYVAMAADGEHDFDVHSFKVRMAQQTSDEFKGWLRHYDEEYVAALAQ